MRSPTPGMGSATRVHDRAPPATSSLVPPPMRPCWRIPRRPANQRALPVYSDASSKDSFVGLGAGPADDHRPAILLSEARPHPYDKQLIRA